MKNKQTIKMVFAGLFFVIGIVAVIASILIIGSDKGLTEAKFRVYVMYYSVGGLLEGAPVRLSGVNVGNVSDIDFSDKSFNGRKVIVTINIFNKFRKQLNDSARFAIKTEGVLGEKFVDISVLASGNKYDVNKLVVGDDPLDMQDMAEIFEIAAISLTATAENLGNVDVKSISIVMGQTAESLLIAAEGLNEMFVELQDVSRKTKRLLDRIEQRVIDGNLFKVF